MAYVNGDYIKGTAEGYKDLLAVIIGWMTEPSNAGGNWSVIQDYVDTHHKNDGERNVILRGDIVGELPIYIGLRTFAGFSGKNQQGIQINAFVNFDPDLPWDCQAGSLALPDKYVSGSHFYEGCPAILVGNEVVCYWLVNDKKHLRMVIRTPTVPMEDSDTKIRRSVIYEMFYLGWMRRLVAKEGYPYPITVQGTTYTLGNETDGYVQRNFAYNNVVGSLRHIPPFQWDYMSYEGIQPRVVYTTEGKPAACVSGREGCPITPPSDLVSNVSISQAYKEPVCEVTCSTIAGPEEKSSEIAYCARSPVVIPGMDAAVVCGPADIPLCIPKACVTDAISPKWKFSRDNIIDLQITRYDVINMSNRVLYFDGTWGWSVAYPVRNAFVKSLCWCTVRIKACASHNCFTPEEPGITPPLSVHSGGVTKDQTAAHFGWLPTKIVESLSGHRLLIPCYLAVVGSLAEMQTHTRQEFGKSDYDAEQARIHIAGLMEGVYYVPGLGLSAQDILKIATGQGNETVEYMVVPDIYRDGPYNYAVIKLGVNEWHDKNSGATAPRA